MLPPRVRVDQDNGIEGVLHIQQISKARASQSDCLVLYLRHSLEVSYPSAEMQLVYSTAPADGTLKKV